MIRLDPVWVYLEGSVIVGSTAFFPVENKRQIYVLIGKVLFVIDFMNRSEVVELDLAVQLHEGIKAGLFIYIVREPEAKILSAQIEL